MSAVAVLLQFLFAFLGFLLSIYGVFTVLLGLVGFIALPVVPRVTGEFKRLANLHLWLATSMLTRIGVVVSKHGDLLLKRMRFDDRGVEKIRFDDIDKEFADPAARLHYWMGVPFALADELHGVIFAPQDAAVGRRKREHDERDAGSFDATDGEFRDYGVHEWKRGVYEFAEGVYELVELGAVRQLVDGGEKAEYPHRTEELYKLSRDPLTSATSATRFIMILAALIGPFGALWLLATQGGGNGGGGGTTVSPPGSILLLAISAASIRELMDDVDWKRAAIIFATVVPIPVIFLLVFVVVSPLTAIFAALAATIGFLSIPLFILVARASVGLSNIFGPMLLRTGFAAYDKPVFEWTPQKYRLREFDDLEDVGDVEWYGLAGSLVGFTFTPTEESWGAEVVDTDGVDRQALRADGGESESNIPADHAPAPAYRKKSLFGAFLPERFKRGKYYIDTQIAWGRFTDSASGERSLSMLLKAKEKHGGTGGLADKTIIYAMLACGIVSLLAGVFVFFL
jgi:hypothetical protein